MDTSRTSAKGWFFGTRGVDQLQDYFASVRICSHIVNSYQIKMNQLHYTSVNSKRSDTSTIVQLCILLISMHCALLKLRHMALSAPLVDVARGSAQRPNLVQL